MSKLVSQKEVQDQGALAVQVGGGHYKSLKIQPVEYCHANNLNFCQGNIIKYATRYKDKGGIEDLKKVKHYVDLLIELEYKEQAEDERATAKIDHNNLLKMAFNQGFEAGEQKEFTKIEEAKAKKLAGRRAAAEAKSPKAVKKIPAFMMPLTPSAKLAQIIGPDKIARVDAMQKIWVYIKKHKLQCTTNRRNIKSDDKLKLIFEGKNQVSMFEMASLISKHLK